MESFNLVVFLIVAAVGAGASPPPDLVRSSCQHARYPEVCVRTLSAYAGAADTPRELALAALTISISRAAKASRYLSGLMKSEGSSGRERERERGAVNDCVGQISDSVEDLRKSMAELKHLRRGTFRWQMSNAETWVSAALTSEDTCLDGFKEAAAPEGGKATVRWGVMVRRKMTSVAKVTSNALYLINRLDDHPY